MEVTTCNNGMWPKLIETFCPVFCAPFLANWDRPPLKGVLVSANLTDMKLNDMLCCLYFSQNVPPDLSLCGFVLAHCLSVRALQEMLTHSEHLAAEVRPLSLLHLTLRVFEMKVLFTFLCLNVFCRLFSVTKYLFEDLLSIYSSGEQG